MSQNHSSPPPTLLTQHPPLPPLRIWKGNPVLTCLHVLRPLLTCLWRFLPTMTCLQVCTGQLRYLLQGWPISALTCLHVCSWLLRPIQHWCLWGSLLYDSDDLCLPWHVCTCRCVLCSWLLRPLLVCLWGSVSTLTCLQVCSGHLRSIIADCDNTWLCCIYVWSGQGFPGLIASPTLSCLLTFGLVSFWVYIIITK